MKGFKDTTRTQYMKGGEVSCYAKGGNVKGAAKISKVMGEFKRGELHSGSKEGPKVTNPKQATAIAMSEAGKTKKAMGGPVGQMPVRKGAPPVKPTAPPIMRDIQGKPPVKPTTPPIMRDIKGKGVPVAPREPLIGRPEDSNNRGRASLGVRRPMR